MENLDKLVTELCKLPDETQWVEFKITAASKVHQSLK